MRDRKGLSMPSEIVFAAWIDKIVAYAYV